MFSHSHLCVSRAFAGTNRKARAHSNLLAQMSGHLVNRCDEKRVSSPLARCSMKGSRCTMALRIFISFAKEDARYRTLLVGRAKNRGVPFEFADMSVQEPYDSKWKTRCREKIKQCDSFYR